MVKSVAFFHRNAAFSIFTARPKSLLPDAIVSPPPVNALVSDSNVSVPNAIVSPLPVNASVSDAIVLPPHANALVSDVIV